MSDKDDKGKRTKNSPSDKSEEAQDPSRRKFIKNTGIATGGVVGGTLLGGLIGNSFSTEQTPVNEEATKTFTEARMFFTRLEDFLVLEQATEMILPKDDNGPGAIELDVPYYIDKQLAGLWGINGQDYRQGPFTNDKNLKAYDKVTHARKNRGNLFLEGLRKMNTESKKRFDDTFDKLDEDQMGDIISDLEEGKIKMRSISSDGFFALLKQATLEGAFSDPLYGGNKNMDGWRMKEFAGAQASYKNVIDSEDFKALDPISLIDYQRQK